MPRKEVAITIKDEGRDKGKTYHLIEMPALQGERWAARALLALVNGGAILPDDAMGSGMAGLAQVSFSSMMRLKFADIEPLLDEMLACIRVRPDPRNPQIERALAEGDIEEVATLIRLRAEVLTLHTGFTFPAKQSTSGTTEKPPTTEDTLTSLPRSGPASRQARPR